MRARAALAAIVTLICISEPPLFARIEGAHVWDSLRIECEAESGQPIEKSKFICVFNGPVQVKFDDTSHDCINRRDIHPSRLATFFARSENNSILNPGNDRGLSGFDFRSIIECLWKCSIYSDSQVFNAGSRLSAVFYCHPNYYWIRSNGNLFFERDTFDGKERAFTLDKCNRLDQSYESQTEGECGDPKSESYHPVWITEGALSKPTARLLILFMTLSFGVASMVLLFGSHDSSVLSIIGILLFFGAPVLLFFGLFWID
jgi:hypothetical protein